MVNEATIIKNPSGLHLRPAGILCKEALKFKIKNILQGPQRYGQCKECFKRSWSLCQMR